MNFRKPPSLLLSLLMAPSLSGQATQHTQLVKVESHSLPHTVPLTAQLLPYLETDVEARVPGYVERVLVDRGSVVRRGQTLLQLSAPEMLAQTSAAESTLHQAEAELNQSQAQAAAAAGTAEKLAEAARTPGAVSGNELLQAQKQKEAADAIAASRAAAVKAAQDRLHAAKEMQAYLRVAAPYDGIITERLVHPGMMVGGAATPLLKLQQVSRLRLVVPVPENYVASVRRGKTVTFHVPARPGREFSGNVARIPQAMDAQSRSMLVELDVSNTDGQLAPGMYPTVLWPADAGDTLLFVPATSVVTTTQRTFVIAVRDGRALWIDVKKGLSAGEEVAVQGDLHAGQFVVKRATDELHDGAPLL